MGMDRPYLDIARRQYYEKGFGLEPSGERGQEKGRGVAGREFWLRDIHNSGQAWRVKRLAQDTKGRETFLDDLYPDPGGERL